MSWESERPNIILTLENIDELEEIYTSASKIFPGLSPDDYYTISSYDPRVAYGLCTAKGIFKALKRLMEKQAFTGGGESEYINHWRWVPRMGHYAAEEKPRPEGGTITHYYNSKEPNAKEKEYRSFTTLDKMNQNTKDYWNEMNSNVIKPPFFRGGDPLKKLGIGIKFENIWWCESNRSVGFSKMTKKEIILEI